MSEIEMLKKENKCLRERLKAIEKIIVGGGNSNGGNSEVKAVRKEPSQNQKVKNYAEILDQKGRYQKPKHLLK